MRKQLMKNQAASLRKMISQAEYQGEFEQVFKFTIDSVIDDKFRIIISNSKEPVRGHLEAKFLARFDMWRDPPKIEIAEKKEAFKRYGIRSGQIKETKVFLKYPHSQRAVEITEFVREESKNHYLPLLKREHSRILKRETQK